MDKMGDKVVESNLINPNPITRNDAQITIDVIENELERFINQFWIKFDLKPILTMMSFYGLIN